MTEVATFARVADAQGAQGAVLGGGTLLMREVNYRPETVPRLIRITDPALREVRPEGERIRIGAGVTMAQIVAHPDLEPLAQAARLVGGPALRNMATVGGNLFAPHPYGDLTVALLALDALVERDGRTEPLEGFLAGRGTPRGVVTAVTVPRLRGLDLRVRKVSRTKPKGVSVLSIAALLTGGGGGRVAAARIAFGAMGPTPLRAKAAEAALAGASLDEAGVAAACAAAADGLNPPDDALASAWYRARVAPVHLKRLLLERH